MSYEQLPQGISSRAVHGGERQQRLGDALTVPIYQTATYVFRDTQELIDFKEGRIDKGEYGRYGNPTVHAAERKLAELEHADEALLWASGMCAITSVLLTLLRPGQHMIITADSYRRTRQFCDSMLAAGHRGRRGPAGRSASRRGRRATQHAAVVFRSADQSRISMSLTWNTSWRLPNAPLTHHDRQYLRHALQPEPTRFRHRPGHA